MNFQETISDRGSPEEVVVAPDNVGEDADEVGDAAGLNEIDVLNSRPIASVIVSFSAAGIAAHVDVFRLMVKVVTCQSPGGALEF
ncbi:MAG: hypothetical protein EXQ63_08155 [Ilumatobacteraceae bacterium]|nr:hypothetical protein [Ilumatobacteraceae bacterium]